MNCRLGQMFFSGEAITILFLEGFIVTFPKRTVDLIKYCEKILLKKAVCILFLVYDMISEVLKGKLCRCFVL